MESRCPNCSTVIPHTAKFCPKCGTRAARAPSHPSLAPDAHPAKAPIPRVGRFFMGAVVLGVALIVLGLVTGAPALAYGGLAILGGFVLLMLAGDLLS